MPWGEHNGCGLSAVKKNTKNTHSALGSLESGIPRSVSSHLLATFE